MVVMTAKVSKAKLIAIFCIAAALICIAAYALFGGDSEGSAPEAAGNAADNEGRIAFLASYGWQVDAAPTETQEVRIPEEMNEVFTAYNELQRTQGFDLSRFAGQKVTRYVYQVTNYANATAPVYASLLVLDGAVIGGDITSTAGAGMMHGFEPPAGSQPLPAAGEAEQETLPSEEPPSETKDADALQEHSDALALDPVDGETDIVLPSA